MHSPEQPAVATAPVLPTTAYALDDMVLEQFRHRTVDGRYIRKRELARGGMGKIWVADDTRLSRRVAIKELIEPTVIQLARFDRELSLTSRLEHPSIVSIHDGGTWPDGTPFYVMRLVTGKSLDRVLARTTSLTERLALLPHGLAAVDAIAYAHAQGIVHRDLKPANVLVGAYGETVVIDWGLAKDLRDATPDRADGPYRERASAVDTVGGEVIGTPAYMPPEQALGDAVDERADVYALGALLYHLLAGAPPHHGGSINSVLASVITDPPPPLATAAPGVPADLVAIIDKAMAQRPDHRYATAAELAVDLKRFHSGQLVGAHRYTGRQLLWRWLRKHRAAVIVASAAAIALAALGTISFTRIVREKQEAQQARMAAELHRGKAEDNHAKAEKLVSFMLVDLGEKLKSIGKLDLLEGVALQARDYYHDQADAPTPDEQHRRSQALHGLGMVLTAKWQAGAALAEHQAALAIRQRLAAGDPKWQPSLAASYMIVGDAQRYSGNTEAGLAAYQSAVAICEKLVAASPDDQTAMQQLAQAYASVGDFYREARRDATAALREDRRALELRKRLVALEPSDRKRQRDLIKSQLAVGRELGSLGDHPKSQAERQEALRLAEALVARDPTDARSLRLVADAHEDLAIELQNQRGLAKALDQYRAALEVNEGLASKDPLNSQLRTLVAEEHRRIADIRSEQRQFEAALKEYRVALEILDQLLGSENSSRLRAVHASVQGGIGSALLEQGHLDAAMVEFERSRVTTEAIAVQEPTNQRSQERLAVIYRRLGDGYRKRKDLGGALEYLRKSLTIFEQIAARDPKDTRSQASVIEAIEAVAETLEQQGETQQAAAEFGRALALSDALLAQDPSQPRWVERADALRKRAATCCKTRRSRP